jgi:hypothetical protein
VIKLRADDIIYEGINGFGCNIFVSVPEKVLETMRKEKMKIFTGVLELLTVHELKRL